MKLIDLAEQKWSLQGWRPLNWRLNEALAGGTPMFFPDNPPMPAQVPGSVQNSLKNAGIIPDWNHGFRSLECEWVEHRHWEFFTDLEGLTTAAAGESVILEADGLDYSGWILVDGKQVATFKGALIRHRINLAAVADGKPHRLSIIFDQPPEDQSIGFTSLSRYFKPRFNFGWDWCPRFVPVGIWDRLALRIGTLPAEVSRLRTEVDTDSKLGSISLFVDARKEARKVQVQISREQKIVASLDQQLQPGSNQLALSPFPVELWWPNGEGDQPLYAVSVRVETTPGETLSVLESSIGFKKVAWLPCEGAPKDAIPWICEVNGKPIFLQGFNWVPPQVDFHSIPESDYRKLISIYRDMGCNTLRVWGGASLERDLFYRLCDEAGLLVWQEFPLSSSAIDNWPPEDPQVIDDLCKIARDYIHRRGHHVSKLLWCGGNELQSASKETKTGIGVPVDSTHPCLAALEKIVAEEDPGTRYIPTSASGPYFTASEANFGKGVHHDVHGPWNVDGPLEDWERYWKNDDALFRSETGTPAASFLPYLQKYCDQNPLWPPINTNRLWLHTSSWWLQWERFKKEVENLPPEKALPHYIALSQDLQAKALSIAARSCRDRFPRCGGFLIWMGHDAFPCASSIACIDYDRTPRPVCRELEKVFKGPRQSKMAE
jgi:beta-mannosidase